MITHRATGIKYAVKCLDISLINTPESLLQLRNEIFIMCQLDHPNVMRIEEVYESNNEIYIIQEICNGGDLFDRLDEQHHYTEAQCAKLVKQVRYISIVFLHCFLYEMIPHSSRYVYLLLVSIRCYHQSDIFIPKELFIVI
jgi:calcium-dependent protein kinase